MARKIENGLDLRSNRIVNVSDPSSAQDAATKNYVDLLISGVRKLASARLMATGNVDISQLNNGDTVDGVVVATGDVVILPLQSTPAEDGWYLVGATAGSTVRWTSMPSGTDARGTAAVVGEGTANGNAFWVQTAEPAVLGTDGLTFVKIEAGVTYTADGQGIELTSTTFGLELDGTTLSKSASGLRIGSGAAGAGLTESSGVLAVGAGTGVTVNANDVAVDSTVARVFQIATHASSTSIGITHSLGKQFVCPHVFITSTGEEIFPDVTATSTTVTTFTFASAPSANTLTFVIHA